LRDYVVSGHEESEDSSLPDIVEFHDFERAWGVFVLEEAIEWKWPLDVVARQDDALMEDVLKIRGLVFKVNKELYPPAPPPSVED
jgi:hypothetical protein